MRDKEYFIPSDREHIVLSHTAKAWGDLEKLAHASPPISVTGTTPEVIQEIAPQPPAGSTAATKRQWLDSLMQKTVAEGYEIEGYTVSIWPPGLQLHYKRKSQ